MSRYFIDKTFDVWTYTDIKKNFIKMPEEIRWDFCNSAEEYIARMIQAGELKEIQEDNIIGSNKLFTPLQYAKVKGIKEINSTTTASEFDKVLRKHGLFSSILRNYVLTANYCLSHKKKVVIVRFQSYDKVIYRYAEI